MTTILSIYETWGREIFLFFKPKGSRLLQHNQCLQNSSCQTIVSTIFLLTSLLPYYSKEQNVIDIQHGKHSLVALWSYRHKYHIGYNENYKFNNLMKQDVPRPRLLFQSSNRPF